MYTVMEHFIHVSRSQPAGSVRLLHNVSALIGCINLNYIVYTHAFGIRFVYTI